MSTTINVSIQDRTPELMQKLEASIERFVVKGSAYIEGQLKTSMAEPKHGKLYGAHRASAPGESPAVDSSNLTGSIATIMASSLESKIGTPVEYAVYLEDGTVSIGETTSGMDPRPLWAPVAKDSLPTLEKMLDKEIGAGRGGLSI